MINTWRVLEKIMSLLNMLICVQYFFWQSSWCHECYLVYWHTVLSDNKYTSVINGNNTLFWYPKPIDNRFVYGIVVNNKQLIAAYVTIINQTCSNLYNNMIVWTSKIRCQLVISFEINVCVSIVTHTALIPSLNKLNLNLEPNSSSHALSWFVVQV